MAEPDPNIRLQLRRHEDRRIRRGHHWVYSNEIDIQATPLKAFAPGQQAVLVDARGAPLGRVYVNPGTLICARLLDRDADAVCDRAWVLRRLQRALGFRQRIYQHDYYRLVYGDSDGLPGLVVDRYGEYLVVQSNTAGVDALQNTLLDALEELLSPRGILLRNDTSVRQLEGLASIVEVVRGEFPERIEVLENGVRFLIDPAGGQKTGWFYDQRDNRQRLAALVPGQRVLDVFSYVGAWGVQSAVAGATEVVCIDSSKPAVSLLLQNAALNAVADSVRSHVGDATVLMRELIAEGTRFDIVIVDPPALIKRRKDAKQGKSAYRRLNQDAMSLLSADGLLVSASCSMHLDEASLIDVIRGAAQRAGRFVQIVGRGGQSSDHPVHPAIPETSYLKTMFCRVQG